MAVNQKVNVLIIILVSYQLSLAVAAESNSWVGSKYQIECTMCAACDNPCNQPTVSPPPSPPKPTSPPPPTPPSSGGSGSGYYYPPPSTSKGPYYTYPPPPPPAPYNHNYPTPQPPNPIMPYFPYYYYSPPPPAVSAAVSRRGSVFLILQLSLVFVFFF